MSYFWAAFRYYTVFRGRTSVKAFWVYQLIYTIITTICWIVPLLYLTSHIPTVLQNINIHTNDPNALALQVNSITHNPALQLPKALELLYDFGNIFFFATIIPTLAICARRLHDSNNSAALLWILLLPLIGFIVIIIYLTFNGTPGDNNYGPDPKNAPGGTIIPGRA